MIDPNGLLMIEPRGPAADEPVIDVYTLTMAAAWRLGWSSRLACRGFHVCACGVASDNREHFVVGVSGTLRTNSLAVHYLAFHRDEVPPEELERVVGLPVYPSDSDLDDLLRRPKKNTNKAAEPAEGA